jgi:trehalose 6-phosphate synthase
MTFAPISLLPTEGASFEGFEARDRERKGRLIVVSNRVAKPDQQHAGGLGHAIANLLGELGGLWIGWSGRTLDEGEATHSEHIGSVDYLTLDLPRDEFHGYYEQYANGALWPLLHARADLVSFVASSSNAYEAVNRRFADLIARIASNDDAIWVQDYHLIPLARMLRDRGLRCRLGFFLHTPMPGLDVFARLPGHESLLRSLGDYDLVGVQTEKDCNALRATLKMLDERDAKRASKRQRAVVRTFPIGVDPERLADDAPAALQQPAVAALKASLADRALIVGVDRLDYSKGIPERIAAMAEFLRAAPEWRRRFTFVQVAPETRGGIAEYRKLGRVVQRRVGEINGHFGDESWTPLRYVNRTYSQLDLLGFYRLARLGLVTPLRDGMNLVAKEYVAAQDATDPGVLVLSEFAGAAHELNGALIVNPFDARACAAAIRRGLEMPLGERIERHASDLRVLRANTIHDWGHGFVDALRASASAEAIASPIPRTNGRRDRAEPIVVPRAERALVAAPIRAPQTF